MSVETGVSEVLFALVPGHGQCLDLIRAAPHQSISAHPPPPLVYPHHYTLRFCLSIYRKPSLAGTGGAILFAAVRRRSPPRYLYTSVPRLRYTLAITL